jgi:hypothetical protein
VLGGQACVAVLTIATLATFLVYVPTALALNGSNAWSRMRLCPALTARAYAALLVLWTATAWLGAYAAPYLHQNAIQA